MSAAVAAVAAATAATNAANIAARAGNSGPPSLAAKIIVGTFLVVAAYIVVRVAWAIITYKEK